MITFYRSACIAPGKVQAARKFATEISSYIKAKTGVEVGAGVPIGGNPNRIGWSSSYESLAAYEATMAKLLADRKYMGMVARSADLWLPGSVHDEIWRSL